MSICGQLDMILFKCNARDHQYVCHIFPKAQVAAKEKVLTHFSDIVFGTVFHALSYGVICLIRSVFLATDTLFLSGGDFLRARSFYLVGFQS